MSQREQDQEDDYDYMHGQPLSLDEKQIQSEILIEWVAKELASQVSDFDDNSDGYNSDCDHEHVVVGADEPTSMSSITLTDGDEGTHC